MNVYEELRSEDRHRKRLLFPRRLTMRSGSNSTAAVPTNIAGSSRPRRRCWWCVKPMTPSIPRNGMGTHYGWIDDRVANLGITFS